MTHYVGFCTHAVDGHHHWSPPLPVQTTTTFYLSPTHPEYWCTVHIVNWVGWTGTDNGVLTHPFALVCLWFRVCLGVFVVQQEICYSFKILVHRVQLHYSDKVVHLLIRIESLCLHKCVCVFLKSSETDFIHYINYELAPLCHLLDLSLLTAVLFSRIQGINSFLLLQGLS